MASFQFLLQIVDSVAERLEVAHIEYLGADVKMKPFKRDIAHVFGHLNDLLHIAHGNAEFVFCQSGRDVGMGVGSDVRIDA